MKTLFLFFLQIYLCIADIFVTETSNSTPKWIWWKEIGIDSAKVLLYLLSIFFGGFLFVFVITKLCFRTKSPKYLLLDENETATSIQLEEKQLQFEDFKMLVQKS